MAPPKGFVPWNKGKHNIYSAATLKSNSDKHKKSYEDRYGSERAKEVRDKIKIKMQQRKLSDVHKQRIGNSNKLKLKGKTLEEIHGEEKAKEIKNNIRNNNWSTKMKGNFPQLTLEKKRLNTLGEKNPMFGKFGENHPGWKGGLSFQPYPHTFNKHFKLSIKIRDNFTCIKCGLSEVNCKQLYSNQGLQIHHADYNKSNTCQENCCCLCHACNAEVNFNRDLWVSFFQGILSQRYGYIYNEVVSSNE